MSVEPTSRAGAPQRGTSSPPPSRPAAHEVEMRRSARRRKTVSAYREGDRTIVLVPARMSEAEEQRWVEAVLDKLAAKESRRARGGDAELAERAERLSAQYLGGRARPDSVRWVTNQNTRWGSCTPAEGSIRLSHRLRGMPDYVVDYVLLHELAHLLVPGHGPAFWELLTAYPRTERARGYLEGVAAAQYIPNTPHIQQE
ncbi:M48 family metallopeptidase [Streptomyces thermodiastaticus]